MAIVRDFTVIENGLVNIGNNKSVQLYSKQFGSLHKLFSKLIQFCSLLLPDSVFKFKTS